jgi:hypothetical protein
MIDGEGRFGTDDGVESVSQVHTFEFWQCFDIVGTIPL